jgi:hypothetical protein
MRLYDKPQFLRDRDIRERNLMHCLKVVDCWVDEAMHRGWLTDEW